MHYHLGSYIGEVVVAEAMYDDREDSLHYFVKLSNGIFGEVNDKDTRITLEECYEALEYDPKALFVGWGNLRVIWAVCAGECPIQLLN